MGVHAEQVQPDDARAGTRRLLGAFCLLTLLAT